MKKKLVLLCLGVFLLCGCELKEETKFTINEDKSMDVEFIIGLDDELIDTMMSMGDDQEETEDDETEDDEFDLGLNTESKEYTDEDRKQYIKDNLKTEDLDIEELQEKGFKLENYQDEKYTGYKISGKITNIDDLIGTANFNLDDSGTIFNKKMFEKNGSIYKGKITVGDPLDSEGDTSTAGINLIYTFTLNLPNKVISSNATNASEDGKTLTWDLAKGNISTIEFEFEFPSKISFLKDNMFIVAGIAVGVVLLIVVIITILLKKSNKKNNINELNNDLNNNITTNINNEQLSQNNFVQEQTNADNLYQQPIMQENIQNVNNYVQNENMNINQNIQQEQNIAAIEQPIMQENIQNVNNYVQNENININQNMQQEQNITSIEQPVMQENLQNINNYTQNVEQIANIQFANQQPIQQTQNFVNNQVISENQMSTQQTFAPQQVNAYPLPTNQGQVQPNMVQPEIQTITTEQQNGNIEQNNNINNQGI